MTDKLTLNDLRRAYYDDDGEFDCVAPATLSDLVEVIESLGGEVKETDTCKDAHVNCTTLEVNGLLPGRYVILPIPEGTPDE